MINEPVTFCMFPCILRTWPLSSWNPIFFVSRAVHVCMSTFCIRMFEDVSILMVFPTKFPLLIYLQGHSLDISLANKPLSILPPPNIISINSHLLVNISHALQYYLYLLPGLPFLLTHFVWIIWYRRLMSDAVMSK